jgi:hypothetical protein
VLFHVECRIVCEWIGPIEGQINRLQPIKRQRYGQAGLDFRNAAAQIGTSQRQCANTENVEVPLQVWRDSISRKQIRTLRPARKVSRPEWAYNPWAEDTRTISQISPQGDDQKAVRSNSFVRHCFYKLPPITSNILQVKRIVTACQVAERACRLSATPTAGASHRCRICKVSRYQDPRHAHDPPDGSAAAQRNGCIRLEPPADSRDISVCWSTPSRA